MTTTPPGPNQTMFLDPPEQKKTKGTWLLLLLIPIVFSLFPLLGKVHGNEHKQQLTRPAHPNYVKGFCTTRKLFDFRDADTSSITIHLQEGCYHGEYRLPEGWDNAFIQKTTVPGDYATVWCNGSPEPGAIRESFEDMGTTMFPCRDRGETTQHFAIEGKGDLTITRTVKHAPLLSFFRSSE